MFKRAEILFYYYFCWVPHLQLQSEKNGLNSRCFCFLKACCKWTNEQNPHCFKKCNKTKLLAVTLLKKIHHSCLMSKFSEILILACKKKCYLLFIRFCIKFFPIAVFSPLCILGFNFHTLWLQVLLHQKLPLLSYDLKAVSLNDKDVKSLSPISSYKTLFINSEADICSCSSK